MTAAPKLTDESRNKSSETADRGNNKRQPFNNAFSSSRNRSNIDDLKKSEESPDEVADGSVTELEERGSWADKTGSDKDDKKGTGLFSKLKSKSPIITIIAVVLAVCIGFSGIMSPALLVVQIKEVMVKKFNTQLASMEVRTSKMWKSKIENTTSGVCGAVITLRCKYSSLSQKQIARLKKAGIDVEVGSVNSLTGKVKPSALIYNGKTIKPGEFVNELATNTPFRGAFKTSYNALFAGFADKIWNKAILNIKISKKGIKIEGATKAEKLKDVQKATSDPVSLVTDESRRPKADDFDTTAEFEKATAEFEKAKKLAVEAASSADNIIKTGTKAATKSLKKGLRTAVSAISITAIPDALCTAYGTIRAIGMAAKTVRAGQLARYAMMYLNVADQIKAGVNPDASTLEYLGRTLTTSMPASEDTRGGTATDSYGYKYAVNRVTGEMPTSATQYLAGAGLTGSLTSVTTLINQYLGNTPQTVCKVLNNVGIMILSAVVGIAAAVASEGITITVSDTVMLAITVATMFLPALLQDVVAGVVIDDNTVGEAAGDAITSGSSSLMGTVAATGGNSPLTPTEAVAYNNLTNEVLAQYAEEDQLAYSPFDPTKSNTFMGKIVASLATSMSGMSSISSALSSISSIVTSSIASIFQTNTNAATLDEYSICQDLDYKQLNLAADPYCNLVYGIPPDILQGIEPMEVLDHMEGEVDPVTGDAIFGSGYYNFLKDCTNRTDPIGYTGDDFQGDSGAGCLINANDKNKYYYLYQIDQRVEAGMSGDDADLVAAQSLGLDNDISFYDGSGVSDKKTNIASNFNSFLKNIFNTNSKQNNNQIKSSSSSANIFKVKNNLNLGLNSSDIF